MSRRRDVWSSPSRRDVGSGRSPSRRDVVVGLTLVLGCSAGLVHAFGAYRYNSAGECFEPAATVDVIEGEDPGECPGLRCWVSPANEVYVTTTACDAPPDYREGTADDAGTCAEALAVYQDPDAGPCP